MSRIASTFMRGWQDALVDNIFAPPYDGSLEVVYEAGRAAGRLARAHATALAQAWERNPFAAERAEASPPPAKLDHKAYCLLCLDITTKPPTILGAAIFSEENPTIDKLTSRRMVVALEVADVSCQAAHDRLLKMLDAPENAWLKAIYKPRGAR